MSAECYSLNGEEYYEESLKDFLETYFSEKEISNGVCLWRAGTETNSASHYAGNSAYMISDELVENACENSCDYAADWVPFSTQALEDFEKELLILIDKYAESPAFFNAVNPEKIKVSYDEIKELVVVSLE